MAMATGQICVPVNPPDGRELIEKRLPGAVRPGQLINNARKLLVGKHVSKHAPTKAHKTPDIEEVHGTLVFRGRDDYISSYPRSTPPSGALGGPEHGAGYETSGFQANPVPRKSPIYTGEVVAAECEHSIYPPEELNHWSINSVGGNLSNTPIRSHRNRESGSEYFNWTAMDDEMAETEEEDGGEQDADDEAEIVSLWGYVPSNDPPPAPPTREGVPLLWERHHDLLVWACRGTIDNIRAQIQYMFQFSPPISEEFLLGRLNGRFARIHLDFLFRYLPGETGTIQQATDRIAMQIRRAVDRDIVEGRQTIRYPALGRYDPQYQTPPMPGNAPADWCRDHDAMLNTFLGEHPTGFLDDCGDFLEHGACLEFLQIRMAQSIHLDISGEEQESANSRIRENRAVRDWIAWRFGLLH
ncbi:hypothetical protein FQN54_009507 [Arachnomyces sp. PD_36]|nr:hypothetical protein FQN54_009507 [Arachnomyces sp. PD_36]